jgi:hypothetical protein
MSTVLRYALAFLSLTATPVFAAPPQITLVTPRGWKTGENTITVLGANLTPATRLVVDLPGATAAVQPDEKPVPTALKFKVTLDGKTPPGIYEARLANEQGLSDVALFVVDQLPNIAEVEPNNDLKQAQAVKLPAALEGRLANSESDWLALDGKKGERFVAEIAARRLGCNFRPVLRLYDANRLELQVARSARTCGGDARLIATLPADGRYYLELHDLAYRGDNLQYRLLVGDLQVADQVFPPGGRRGATLAAQLSGGTLPNSGLSTKVALNVPAGQDFIPVTVPAGPNASPLPLVVAVSDGEELVEQSAADGKPQSTPLPVTINGRISQPGERDSYQIAVTPGGKLRITLVAEPLGSLLDGVVELRNEKGAVLATQDDGPGSPDPDFVYAVPADAKTLTVNVFDVNGHGGPAFNYRLHVEPTTEGQSFELNLLSPLVNVPAGGSASVRVRAIRNGYTGPIRLKVVGDAATGLKLSGAEIGEGVTDTWLSLVAPSDMAVKAGSLQVVGEAGPAEKPTIVRTAKLLKLPMHEGLPWLQSHFASAITTAAPLALEIEPIDQPLRGIDYLAKVKVRRAEGQTGPIKLAMQTSQVAVQGQQQLPALNNVTIAENANEGEIKIAVPTNAPEIPLVYVISGQLLDAKDKKTVVATVEAASVATKVAFPFRVEVAKPPELKPGMKNLVPAKLVRLGSFKQPVDVTLTGLPGTVKTEKVTVPADKTDFEIPIELPPKQAAGPLANVKITATWVRQPPLAAAPKDLPLVVAAPEAK